MNKSFGLGRAHEVLIRDLGRLERCKLVLMIDLGKQTQAISKSDRPTQKPNSKQQQKRVDTVLLRGAVRKERKKEEKEASEIDVDI